MFLCKACLRPFPFRQSGPCPMCGWDAPGLDATPRHLTGSLQALSQSRSRQLDVFEANFSYERLTADDLAEAARTALDQGDGEQAAGFQNALIRRFPKTLRLSLDTGAAGTQLDLAIRVPVRTPDAGQMAVTAVAPELRTLVMSELCPADRSQLQALWPEVTLPALATAE